MPDAFRPVPPPADDEEKAPLPRRLFWFFAIALVSVAVTAAVAYALRSALL